MQESRIVPFGSVAPAVLPADWPTMATEAVACAERIVADSTASGFDGSPNAEWDWLKLIQDRADDDRSFGNIPPACPRIFFCVPTFKRTWQIIQTLPINLVLSWKYRTVATFVVADLNEEWDSELWEMFRKCEKAREYGMLRIFRRHVPGGDGWRHWHASIGKNCAHMAAIHCAKELGGQNAILVGLDNDNFVSDQFFMDIFSDAAALTDKDHPKPYSGIRWRHPNCPPCTGRTLWSVACPRKIFCWHLGYWLVWGNVLVAGFWLLAFGFLVFGFLVDGVWVFGIWVFGSLHLGFG